MLVGMVLAFSQKLICQDLVGMVKEKVMMEKEKVMEVGRDGLVVAVVAVVLGISVGVSVVVLVGKRYDMMIVIVRIVLEILVIRTTGPGKGKVVNIVGLFLSEFLRTFADM